jgi:TonB-dependent receptor
MFGLSSRHTRWGVAMAALVCAMPANAQLRSFDIAAQPLKSALRSYGEQSGMQILATDEVLAHRQSGAVRGQLDPRRALDTLLTGSGVAISSYDGRTVTLRAVEADPRPFDQQGDAEAEEAIVVTGSPIKDSIARSLDEQRRAPNVVSVIASDTIGRFPDQTAASALSRLPGVAVQRDQGQERYIQVRGAPARWTTVAFNGVDVLGAGDRVFRFDSVPSAIISSVAINKTLTPEMPAESLAGRVDIRTYSPLDNPGLHLDVNGGLGFVDSGGDDQELVSGRASWANDKIGVVLGGSHFQFTQQTDNAEPRYDAIGISQLRTATYVVTRETNSLSGSIEFEPAPGHRITATSLYSEFIDHETRNQYTFYLGAAQGTRDFRSGDLNGVEVRGLFQDGRSWRDTFYNVLHGEHELGDDIEVRWDLGYTETEASSDGPLIEQRQSPDQYTSLSYKVGANNLPTVTLYDTVRSDSGMVRGGARTSLDQYAFNEERISISGSTQKTKDYLAKLGAKWRWNGFGADSELRVGAQYNDREFVATGSYTNTLPDGTRGQVLDPRTFASALGVPWTPNAFVTHDAVTTAFGRGFTFNFVDNHALGDQARDVFDALEKANAAGGNYAVPRFDPTGAFTIKERIASAYVQNSWDWDGVSVLAGLRLEHTRTDSNGLLLGGGGIGVLDLKNDYTFLFPSLHVNVDVTPKLKARGAFISGSARPNFGDLSATTTVNDANASVSGGNPFLKPERAYGFDAALEWYFAPSAILSASAFYRDVKDVLYGSTALVGDDRYDSDGFDRSAYSFSSLANGEKGKLYGIELNYIQPFTFLPGLLSGLGVEANATFLDGSFDTPESDGTPSRKVSFPGTSSRLFGLTGFYEKYGLSVRLSYQHRSGWLDEISDGPTSDLYWAPTDRLDLSARYQLTSDVSLFADMNNLTNEPGIRYFGQGDRPYERERFGRRFLFGARVSM